MKSSGQGKKDVNVIDCVCVSVGVCVLACFTPRRAAEIRHPLPFREPDIHIKRIKKRSRLRYLISNLARKGYITHVVFASGMVPPTFAAARRSETCVLQYFSW